MKDSKNVVKVRAYINPTKEILEKDIIPEKGWTLSGALKGMKEALKVYGGFERKNWKGDDIKIVKVFEDGTEEEISLKDSVPEDKRKELREMYDRLCDVLTEGANADIPNNIKKAYDIVGGRCYFHEKKPTFLSVEGKVGDYTLTNMISLNERLYGDLNRLASDLTMAYAKSKGIDPEMRTPEFIRSIKDERINFSEKARKVANDALSGVTPYAMRMQRQNEREAIETQLSEIEHLIDLREDFLESDKADDQPEEVLNRIMRQIKYLNIKKSELSKRYEDLFSQEYGYWEIGDAKDEANWIEKNNERARYWNSYEGKAFAKYLGLLSNQDLLSKYSLEEDPTIREIVAGNTSTPHDVLKRLSKDENGFVRSTAKKTLDFERLTKKIKSMPNDAKKKKANMNDYNYDWREDDDIAYDDYDDDRPKHRYWFYIYANISTEISNGTLSESELYDVKHKCFDKFADEFLDSFEGDSEFNCDITELGVDLSDNVEEENMFDFVIDTDTEEYTEQELKKMFADSVLLEKTYSGDTESGVHYDCKIKVINIVYDRETEYTGW